MASISTPPPHNLAFSTSAAPRLTPTKWTFYPHPSRRSPDPASLCRCSAGDNSSSSSSSSDNFSRWDFAIQDILKNAMKRFDSVLSWYGEQHKDGGKDAFTEKKNEKKEGDGEEDEWDWERWKKHFELVDEQERLLSVLKSQLNRAVEREDYEDAARLKVAIAATATDDTVGRVMSYLNKAAVGERYKDAAVLRDQACAGLVGWWSGISEDIKDPYGLIIQITAEHGRYVARSFNPRQLTAPVVGAPLFEIFLTVDGKGKYKKQAVHLKWKEVFPDASTKPRKTSNSASLLTPSRRKEDRNDFPVETTDDEEESNSTDDDSDILEESSGFQSFLQDMIPGANVRVLKVTFPGKVDRDFISNVIDQITDDEGEEKDIEEDVKVEDENKVELDEEKDELELESVMDGIVDSDEGREITIKVVLSDIADRLSGSIPLKESQRFPASLETTGRSCFSLHLEKDANQQDSKGIKDIKSKLQGRRRIDDLLFGLANSIEKEKRISSKMLKDVGELLSLTLGQVQNRQQLSGLTTFHRINVTPSLDPLHGLYIGAHGLYTSEVINLERKFGQWEDESDLKPLSNFEFYEYIEAVKLTGDPYVPAGKVAFRAKIGKHYQLPHTGHIPDEFGVIARYKGQGRLAEPGFRNPRWVDGELVVLDGKYIKGGPVVGFIYWAPEYHFIVFFNRLRLQT